MNGVTQHKNGVNGEHIIQVRIRAMKEAAAKREMEAAARREESGLAMILLADDNPFTLFKEWHASAQQSELVLPNALCFSTATKEGRVSSRHVILRRLDDDGFVIMTDRRSKKAAELAENPAACMTFLWCYRRGSETINQQVRIEGDVVELAADQVGDLYEREPLYCKVRTHLCHQGVQVDWHDLKDKHDDILKKVADGTMTLPCPEHFVAYKLHPKMIEFYYAHDSYIGDRIMFLKKGGDKWEHTRIAA